MRSISLHNLKNKCSYLHENILHTVTESKTVQDNVADCGTVQGNMKDIEAVQETDIESKAVQNLKRTVLKQFRTIMQRIAKLRRKMFFRTILQREKITRMVTQRRGE